MSQVTDFGTSVFRIVVRSMVSDQGWADSSISDLKTVWTRVGSIFTTYCQGTGSLFSRAEVLFLWEPLTADTLRNYELVVYLVDSWRKSQIKRLYSSTSIDPDSTGLTYVQGSLNLSEVYLNADYHTDPALLANTMIHELMHNKLNMDDSMHSLAPFVGDIGGFAQASLPSNTNLQPTSADISNMAPALSSVVPQQIGI
jgi:hypothetical protein